MCLVGDRSGNEDTDVGVHIRLAFRGPACLCCDEDVKGRHSALICLKEDIKGAFTGLTPGPHR
jgi:hypothetical protein